MKGLVWFREDLRLHDNSALYYADKHSSRGIIGIYIIDTSLWKKHHMAACRIQFMLSGLNELGKNLQKRGIPLLIKKVKKTADIPHVLYRCIEQYSLNGLFYNRQYEVNETRRDQAVSAYLEKKQIVCNSYDDQVILAPGTVLTKKGDFFNVFTPFKRAYIKLLLNNRSLIKYYPPPKKQKDLAIKSDKVPAHLPGFSSDIKWPAGETQAQKRLKKFIDEGLFDYHKYRDFPALSGTSLLSPYLSTGMISARQCFLAALLANDDELDGGNKGALTWMSELIWREFYKHLLVAFPRLSMHKAYRIETEKLKWRYNEKQLLAWQQGKTGYPIIDAGMRQLNQLGWMHNRLRMIVAMFLSKNLFFDWRLGEDYFIRHLIDGDLAANNGGWQWSASTGTDAAPYFRVFNPIRQSERFDPNGDFIRQYCPELAAFDARSIHAPYERAPQLAQQCAYPKPIVDIKASRLAAINAFKRL